MLPKPRKYKNVLAWSGDFGLGQYVSWNIPSEELTLEVIWKKGLKNFANHKPMK